MSNLGLYQWIVSTSKKVGGPGKLIGLFVGGGIVGGVLLTKGGEATVKKIRLQKEPIKLYDKDRSYMVHEPRCDNNGHMFCTGDKFHILAYDDSADMLMIEIIGDNDNPYCVSADLVAEISDFNKR